MWKILQSTTALSLTSLVSHWLANSRYPRILHLFDRACNLINEHRDVLSIVTPQIGDGPFNVVVKDNVLFSDRLNIESLIYVSPSQLNLGDLTIHTADAKHWNPSPNWDSFHANKNKISNYLKHGGFDTLLGEPSVLLNHRNFPVTQSLASNLCSSLVNADISSCLMAATKLAGLGAGLTPAGDDFIMGAIYAAWIIHPFEVASVLARKIVNSTAPRTTSLSAAWLRCAGRGEAGILWHTFFDALISSDAAAIQSRITKLLSVGHTSGADALSGFIRL